ncbi:MAG TPA: cache domain-containing protein [Noviherbaspirillum sp.]|nr:cache domain-containing protein [Noviherbaspirillum sp.]
MQKLLKAILLSCCFLAAGSAGAADKATQEQAVALVKKAAAYLHANGRDKALAEFSNPKGQFTERDLYVFVNDLSGNTLAHGGNPKLVGKNVMELKDADGKLFIKEMTELAKAKGKGWVDYKWPNPVTKAIDAKTTYVERVGDVMIGCGIYK